MCREVSCTISPKIQSPRPPRSLPFQSVFLLPLQTTAPPRRPNEKAGSTPGCSQAVPHPSTNRALCRLTSEVERDPVHSTRYGRQRELYRANMRPTPRTQTTKPRPPPNDHTVISTVAILAQGTHWAVATSQAFLPSSAFKPLGARSDAKSRFPTARAHASP